MIDDELGLTGNHTVHESIIIIPYEGQLVVDLGYLLLIKADPDGRDMVYLFPLERLKEFASCMLLMFSKDGKYRSYWASKAEL